MKKLFIILIVLIIPEYCLAKGFIDLGDGSILEYEIGNIDPENFNGLAQGLSIIEDGKKLAEAESLVINSRSDSAIDSFKLTGFKLSESDDHPSLEIGSIMITDFPTIIFNNPEKLSEGYYNFGLEHKNFSFDISDISIEDKDFYLKIGSVSLPKILYVLSSAGNPYAKNSEFKINKLVGNAKPENIDAMPAHMVLAALGQEAFEFDFRVKANVDDRGLAFEMNTLVELSMKGGFGFDLNFKYNVPAELIVKLEGYAKQGYFNQESLQDDAAMQALGLNMLSELGSIQLSKIEILLQDKGLRKPLLLMLSSNLGINEEETIQMAINALYSSLQAIIPQNVEKVEKSISEFLINGGKLKLTISPPNPVPIMAAGGLLMMPDLAIESLGVSLNHIP